MKITGVSFDNRRRAFEVTTRRGVFTFPYGKCQPAIVRGDKVIEVEPDSELAREGFTYQLASGAEGSVPMDGVLDYNADPRYLADLALYELTCHARDRFGASGIGVREAARRLGTSPPQLYRLLDPANRSKNAHQLLALMALSGVSLGVTDRPGGETAEVLADRATMKATAKRSTAKARVVSQGAVKPAKRSTATRTTKSAGSKKSTARVAS